MKELIVDELQSQILSGTRRPGEVLRQEELASDFGVSVTPVREALRELSARGLVVHEAHRGVRVAEASLERHEELAQIRMMLESYATRLATPCLSAADIARLESLTQRMGTLMQETDQREIRRLNYEFHMLIYEASESPHLIPMIRMAWGAFHWEHLMLIAARLPSAVADHIAIVDALRARDPEAAEALMREHIRSGARALSTFAEAAEESAAVP